MFASIGFLGEVADSCVRRAQRHRSGVEILQIGEHPEQGRLAGAVGAHQPHAPAGRELELHVVEQDGVAKRQRQVAGVERGGRHALLSTSEEVTKVPTGS